MVPSGSNTCCSDVEQPQIAIIRLEMPPSRSREVLESTINTQIVYLVFSEDSGRRLHGGLAYGLGPNAQCPHRSYKKLELDLKRVLACPWLAQLSPRSNVAATLRCMKWKNCFA